MNVDVNIYGNIMEQKWNVLKKNYVMEKGLIY